MKATKSPSRAARFMPAGIPRYIRCYEDRDTDSFDRFTVVYTGRAAVEKGHGSMPNEYPYVGLSGHGGTKHQPCDTMKHVPGKPTGYQWPPAMGRKCHLGTRIPFAELPLGLQRTVLADYREIWRIGA